jgi:hypothetical protein
MNAFFPVIQTNSRRIIAAGAAATVVKDIDFDDLEPQVSRVLGMMNEQQIVIFVAKGLKEAVGTECYDDVIAFEQANAVFMH